MMSLGLFRSDLQKIVKKGSKFGPPGPKNGHFWPFFGHFPSFSDLEIFLVNEFFWFFNMMFLGIIRSDLQKIVKKGQNSALQGQKRPFFDLFPIFSDLKICPVNDFVCFFNMVFLSVFRSYFHKIVKKGQNLSLKGQKLAIFAIFAVFWTCNFSNEWIFWFFIVMFLGIFRSDLQKIVKKG